MEFACGFVYVPPPWNHKESQQIPPNVPKRPVPLPPAGRVRPRVPPPPPPPPPPPHTSSPKSSSPAPVSKDVKKVLEVTPMYENAQFHAKQLETAASSNGSVEKLPVPRKTALLPPPMKTCPGRHTSSNNPPFVSPNNNNNTWQFTNALPKVVAYSRLLDPSGFYPRVPTYQIEMKLPEIPKPVLQFGPKLPIPEYLELLPSDKPSPSLPKKSLTSSGASSPNGKVSYNNKLLPGNPNVVLVSLGKLLSEEKAPPMIGKPMFCLHCGSVLDTNYDNLINVCYFCQPVNTTNTHSVPKNPFLGYSDGLFLLNPDESPGCADDALLIFCIDISGSMSITSEVLSGESTFYRSRLQFVQDAVLQCVQNLSAQQPDIRVGLISFNYKVVMHGSENHPSRSLTNSELRDSNCLKMAAARFPIPPPLSQTKDYLQRQVIGLSETGTTALGPAALLAVAMASRHSGSKVIICTDGKANTDLGNLEVEDNDARTLLSSTIFYQDLGDYAANHGVTVSVLSIEGTDCRLDELGRLADRTGGEVVVASPDRLHTEFEQIIENRSIATHCTVTLLLPKSLHLRGEREAAHKGIREVGNVVPDLELTFQFGTSLQDTTVPPPVSGSRVSIQLQIRYRKKNGQMMLRVLTVERKVTDDSSAALSSLSVAIIQLNSSQASAALAVRGRFLDARVEGELQMKLIEKAIENNRSAEDKETYQSWVKTMEPLYNNAHQLTRNKSVTSDGQSLTDAGAALLYTMKHINRKSMKNKH